MAEEGVSDGPAVEFAEVVDAADVDEAAGAEAGSDAPTANTDKVAE